MAKKHSTVAPKETIGSKLDLDAIYSLTGALSVLFEGIRAHGNRIITELTDETDSDLVQFPELVADKGDLLLDQIEALVERSEKGGAACSAGAVTQ